MLHTGDPLVSILVPTYNHAPFIEKCLQGISDQVCNFEFEIVLCDDASLDNTLALIKAFEARYTLPIQPIYRTENAGMNRNVIEGLNRCKSKYIAICEGDDFWTEPGKLQAQIDFMESHTEYAICFHPVEIIETETGRSSFSNTETPEKTSNKELAKGNFIHTASAVLRNYQMDYPEWLLQTPAPDYGIFMLHGTKGPIKMINKPMAVYRKHQAGIWSSLDDYKMREKIVSYLLLMKNQFDDCSNKTMTERLEILLSSLVTAYAGMSETVEKARHYHTVLAEVSPNHELSRMPVSEVLEMYKTKHAGVITRLFRKRN